MGHHMLNCNVVRCRGFTLIELLVTMVIIGILAALVAPSLYQKIEPAKAAAARSQIQNFMTGLDSYFLDVGSFPSTKDGLEALRQKPSGASSWNGPYLRREIPKDPWGQRYVYRAPGRNGPYEIMSLGSDGKLGGEGEAGDIKSWEAH